MPNNNFQYKPCGEVNSPQADITNVEPLFDGGADSFSVAIVEYKGGPAIGIRWNASDKEKEDDKKKKGNVLCKGIPASHGVPIWFFLPESAWASVYDIIRREIVDFDVPNRIDISLNEIKEKLDGLLHKTSD